MLSNIALLDSLNFLQRLYTDASLAPPAEQVRICKFGLLELCGWIEEAQDYIVNGCVGKLIDSDLREIVVGRVKRNSGFDVSGNFVPLLGLVIGLREYELIRAELVVNEPFYEPAMNALDALKVPRNTHAHTHFSAANSFANAHLMGRQPTLLIIEANKIHVGFSALENSLINRGHF